MHIYVAYTIEIGYPPALSGYFNENKEIHPHNTRHKEDFHTYSVLSHEGKRAIKVKGSILLLTWNKLPADLKGTKSLLNFRNKLKSYLLHSLE